MNIYKFIKKKAFGTIFLISILIFIFSFDLPKCKDPNKPSTIGINTIHEIICDVEKQSKFILECIKANTIQDMQVIGDCERMSRRLYCK